jgi:hypothetical protein
MAEKRQPQSTTPQEAFVLAYVEFLVKILEIKAIKGYFLLICAKFFLKNHILLSLHQEL